MATQAEIESIKRQALAQSRSGAAIPKGKHGSFLRQLEQRVRSLEADDTAPSPTTVAPNVDLAKSFNQLAARQTALEKQAKEGVAGSVDSAASPDLGFLEAKIDALKGDFEALTALIAETQGELEAVKRRQKAQDDNLVGLGAKATRHKVT